VLAAAWAGGGLSRGLARGPASLQRGASARST